MSLAYINIGFGSILIPFSPFQDEFIDVFGATIYFIHFHQDINYDSIKGLQLQGVVRVNGIIFFSFLINYQTYVALLPLIRHLSISDFFSSRWDHAPDNLLCFIFFTPYHILFAGIFSNCHSSDS